MRKFQIVTDSSCDLPKFKVEELGLKVVQLDVLVEGRPTKADCDVDPKEFYAGLREGLGASTAAANIDKFTQVFEEIVAEGLDVLYIGFSSGLSATYQASAVAAADVMAAHPECKIVTVDSLCASLGEGLLVYHAAMQAKDGKTIEEVAKFVEDNKLNLCHWFTVDDLHFLKRGGRISAATAVVGSMLSIKPILHVDDEGHLVSVSKTRGRRKSVEELFHMMEETAIKPAEQVVYISHGDCLEDAEYLAQLIREKWGNKEILINYVGPVIGAHSGPGTLALFFLGKKR
ncbi:MAG: DegV family protein [Clostridia bacterium]|nr:DegV family protein [Clostridia bacterium]